MLLGRDLNPLAAVQALKAKNGSPIKAFEDDGKISISKLAFLFVPQEVI
jgi:hypothetical protein